MLKCTGSSHYAISYACFEQCPAGSRNCFCKLSPEGSLHTRQSLRSQTLATTLLNDTEKGTCLRFCSSHSSLREVPSEGAAFSGRTAKMTDFPEKSRDSRENWFPEDGRHFENSAIRSRWHWDDVRRWRPWYLQRGLTPRITQLWEFSPRERVKTSRLLQESRPVSPELCPDLIPDHQISKTFEPRNWCLLSCSPLSACEPLWRFVNSRFPSWTSKLAYWSLNH